MNGHPILIHSVVSARGAEMRAEADQARVLNEVRRINGVPSAIALVRRLVGNAMVRAGQRIEGRVAQPKAGERLAAGSVLRVAR